MDARSRLRPRNSSSSIPSISGIDVQALAKDLGAVELFDDASTNDLVLREEEDADHLSYSSDDDIDLRSESGAQDRLIHPGPSRGQQELSTHRNGATRSEYNEQYHRAILDDEQQFIAEVEQMISPGGSSHSTLDSSEEEPILRIGGSSQSHSGLTRENRSDSFSQRAVQRVQVVVRLRPFLAHDDQSSPRLVKVVPEQRSVQIVDHSSFTFDAVHGMNSSQREIYDRSARSLVDSCLEGYNATILAYGQTGTGKTYTMEGNGEHFEDRGVVPRAIEQIFSHIQEKASTGTRFLVRASYLQIYNDIIYDLLKPENANLQIREDDRSKENTKGVYVEGLSEWVVRSPAEIFKLMARGAAVRATGKTKLNEVSSRSHAILKIIVEQCETTFVDLQGRAISSEEFEKLLLANAFGDKSPEDLVRQRFRVAKLNLVDLAGSERVRISGATGQRLEESRKINRSLSALGNVISALTDERGRQHIPYRDSKLTRILEDSLGGNCKTAMYAMISPAGDAISETLSTLKFANRAKSIQNKACVNEDVDKNSLLRKYERELKRLRRELAQKSKNVVDQRVVLELEDQKRRAEADKMAALRALESRSFEFMREKEAKRRLEERISQLQSKMLMGDPAKNVQETPQFRMALKAHRDQIRAEYTAKLEDLEREREQIELQLAQTDRYKQLLLKQRDIMVNLTQRLNERDDQIIALQDELDESERKSRDTEERLDQKTTELIHLKRLALESQHAAPGEISKTIELRQALGIEPGQEHRSERNSDADTSHGSISSTTLNAVAIDEQSEASVKLESRVRALTEQYQVFREQMTNRLVKRDGQLRSVREENAKLRIKLEKILKEQKDRGGVPFHKAAVGSFVQPLGSGIANSSSTGVITSMITSANGSSSNGKTKSSNIISNNANNDNTLTSGSKNTSTTNDNNNNSNNGDSSNNNSNNSRQSQEEYHNLLTEMEKLRQRSINHAKEQLAMQTIMDKIKTIVVQVRSQSDELPDPVNKDLTGLFNLVTRCLQALAISENKSK